MENTNVQEVKMPITYDDLKKSLVDSGRPYDFAMIDRAYALAEKAHGEQRRRSGEPYICHPLSVAQILVELGMDSESIAAALMHDVAEDTPVTVAEIKQKFGPEVALLVDGVTKLTQIKFSNVEDRQAENLRQDAAGQSQDVRVMIIKLCDRLHNMRTRRRLARAEATRPRLWKRWRSMPPSATASEFPTSRRSLKTAVCTTLTLSAMRRSVTC